MVPGPERIEGPALFAHPLAAAVVKTVAERGYDAATVEEISARAGVSPREFERLFADKADAVLRVFEAHIDDFRRQVQRAYDRYPEWPESLRAAGYAAIDWVERHPGTLHYGMVDILEAGEMARVRREDLFRWCAGLIDAGREVAPEPAAVASGAALMAVGAIVELITRNTQEAGEAELAEVLPEMMYGAVRPYLGEAVAQRELSMPRPRIADRS